MAELGPVTCAGCGLLCDDVVLDASGDVVRLGRAAGSAPSGSPNGSHRRRARRRPRSAVSRSTSTTAVSRAGELLRGARRPLIHGFERRHRGGRTGRGGAGRPARSAHHDRAWRPLAGRAGGAAARRLDRDARRDPRPLARRRDLARGPGDDTPAAARAARLRAARRRIASLVVVDDRDTATARRADAHLRWARDHDLDALTSLHVLHRGLALRPASSRWSCAG